MTGAVCTKSSDGYHVGAVRYCRYRNCVFYIKSSLTSGNNSENGTIKHGALSSPDGQSGSLRCALILKKNGRTAENCSALRSFAES